MHKDLYYLPVQIQLTALESGGELMSLPLVDNDFKIFKGAHPNIEFAIRDHNRKPFNLVGKGARIVIRERSQNLTILSKKLKVIDERKGRVKLDLKPYEFQDWDSGNYVFSVLIIDECGDESLTYTDRNQGASGYLEVVEGVLPLIDEAVEINDFVIMEFDRTHGNDKRYVSQKIQGNAQAGSDRGIITFQVYPVNFTGRLWVQASLETDPVSYHESWFEVPLAPHSEYYYFRNCSNTQAFNIKGVYSWLRFLWQRDVIDRLHTNASSSEREEFKNNNIIQKVLVKTR